MIRAPIVDCHHHLWDLAQHRYEWLQADPIFDTLIGDYSPICQDYLIEDYLADAAPAGVTKSVHVQCEFDPSDPVGETEWLQGIADEHGFPHGIVGFVNLADPDAPAQLEAHARFANFRGVRHNLNWDDDDPRSSFADRGDYLTDDTWLNGFSRLEHFGASFDLQILPQQMNEAADVAAAHPATTVILDHVGLPLDRTPDAMEMWADGMRRVAACPNTVVKLSGFGMMDNGWTVETIRPIVLETIDMFTVDRCMFASNFPVDSLGGAYSDFFTAYREIVKEFSADEQSMIFGANAERIYRL